MGNRTNDKNYREKLPSHYSLSVIVPAYNEVDNILPLAKEFEVFLSRQKFRAEVIVVDDGSDDGTAEKTLELAVKYPFLKLVKHKQNMGKTAAIETGFSVSKGKRIAIFDADLQYDPYDLKRMMDKLDRGYGIVSGIKKGQYQKPLVSKIYNFLTRRLFGINVKDMNSMKMLRREVMAELFLRKDWHRFMVVLASQRGYRVADIPVKLRPRLHGKPKYSGFGRIFIGLTDLLAVWLSEKIFRKPMLYFGSTGFISLLLAGGLALFIFIARLGFHWGYPPLQTILILLISVSGFTFTLGFLAEAIANLRDRVEFLMLKQQNIEAPKLEVAKKQDYQKKERPTYNKSERNDFNDKSRPSSPERESKKSHDRRPDNKPSESKKLPKKKIHITEKKNKKEAIKEPALEKEVVNKPSEKSFEIVQRQQSWGRSGRVTHKNVVANKKDNSREKIEQLAKDIDSDAKLGCKIGSHENK
ncbi:glycosyltransferase [bacterium]|nr:glycosyltransferase [bacterium]